MLAALYDVLAALGADLDFERGFRRCLERLCGVCAADRSGVYELEGGVYLPVASVGLPESGGFARDAEPFRAAERRRAAVIDDSRSSLAVPLRCAGRHVGALLLSAGGQAGRMTRQHCLPACLIAGKLAQTLVASRRIRRLAREARVDALTGLPNARASRDRLDQEVARAERESASLGVLFVDIDGLKPVNDRCGHAAGDRLLRETARRLQRSLRSYDFVGRIGGDEFLAILPGAAPAGFGKRIRALKRAAAGVSIGAAFYPRDGATAAALLEASDRAMYRGRALRGQVESGAASPPVKSEDEAMEMRCAVDKPGRGG